MNVIWQVKVWPQDANISTDNYQMYHFQNRSDVLKSIETTFSKMQDEIEQNIIGPRNGMIVVNDRKTGRFLVEATAIEFDLLNNWTHF